MVSAITVHRRGARPVDTFSVSATAPRGDYLLQLLPPLLLRSLTASPPCSPLHRPALRSPPCSPLSSVLSVWQILDDGLVNDIFGHKVLKLQEKSGMAVKLFAPIDIELRGRRVNEAGELDKAGELVRVKELVVKGHYGSLVPDLEHPGSPIFRLDTEGYAYPGDVAADRRGMATALLRASARGENVAQEFVAWATGVGSPWAPQRTSTPVPKHNTCSERGGCGCGRESNTCSEHEGKLRRKSPPRAKATSSC